MRLEKKHVVTLTLGAIWLLIVAVLITMTVKVKSKTNDIETETVVVEDIPIEEPVVYSDLTDIEFSYENIISSLSSTSLSEVTKKDVAEILVTYLSGVTTWKIQLNEDSCSTISLFTDSETPVAKVHCMKDYAYVVELSDKCIYRTSDYVAEYSNLTVDAIVGLFNKSGSDWDWGIQDAVWAYGFVNRLYPNSDINIQDGMLLVNNNPVAKIDKAQIIVGNDFVPAYDKLLSDEVLITAEDYWLVPESFSVKAIEEYIASNSLPIPKDLEQAFEYFKEVYDYWYITNEDSCLNLHTVKLGEDYKPTGYVVYPVASYDYNEGLWRF